jgi:hypothetical protein
VFPVLQIIADHAADICAIATCAALIIKPLRDRILGVRKVQEGQRCLLRTEIVRIYYHNQNDQKLREYEYRNLEHCYKAYKRLGGNSFIDHLYQVMQNWAIEE